MTISEEEWAALPEEEKDRRINEFKVRVREILKGYDKQTIIAALKATLEEMKDEPTRREGEDPERD